MDCIDLFKRAAMALQTDPRYLALDQARKLNDNNEELQNMIGEFNLARMDLNNEIGKSERSDARVSELNEKVNDLYGKIMADEGMVAYNEAKKDCENLVNYIDAIINTAMNGGDPMTVQEPSASCTGSCSTCGGCHWAHVKRKTRLRFAGRVFLAKAVTLCKPEQTASRTQAGLPGMMFQNCDNTGIQCKKGGLPWRNCRP